MMSLLKLTRVLLIVAACLSSYLCYAAGGAGGMDLSDDHGVAIDWSDELRLVEAMTAE